MSIVLETLAKIAPTELTVLIQGETGTGKSFTPSESGKSKAVQYSLKEGEITGVAANSGPFKYYWTLS